VSDWKPADRRKLRAIRDRLRKAYGRPEPHPHHAPVDELILTVLSQNTNDRNRDVAYARLRERFSSWAEVRDADEDEVEEAIRPGGISRVKAGRIQQILRAIGDDDLSRLADEPLEQARQELVELPGVPVDTHVYRVGTRLGLFRPKASFEEAHDEMLRLVGDDADEAYEVHVGLIRHGRRTCTARNPDCDNCPLLSLCPYGKARQRAKLGTRN
jgi:endonuclease-3